MSIVEDVKIEEAKWAKDVLIERTFEQQEAQEEFLIVRMPSAIVEEDEDTSEFITDSDYLDSISRGEESKDVTDSFEVRQNLNNLSAQVSIATSRSRKASFARASAQSANGGDSRHQTIQDEAISVPVELFSPSLIRVTSLVKVRNLL